MRSPRPDHSIHRSTAVVSALLVVVTLLAASCTPSPVVDRVPDHPVPPLVRGGAPVAAGALRWGPPPLESPTTVRITNSNRNVWLQGGRDYVIEFPDTPIDVSGGVVISGGRNVVIVGGRIHHSSWRGTWSSANRGLLVQGQTGTVHIEGLHITGHLTEGIDLSQPEGAVVQIQNVRVEKVVGSKDTNHADIVQTWAGPRVLRMHNVTGVSTYQGIFLRPNDTSIGHRGRTQEVTLSRIQIIQTGPNAAYAFWKGVDGGIDYPLSAQDLWVTDPRSADRGQVLWPKGTSTWDAVSFGRPPGGDFVPATAVGVAYSSPGAG